MGNLPLSDEISSIIHVAEFFRWSKEELHLSRKPFHHAGFLQCQKYGKHHPGLGIVAAGMGGILIA